MKILRIAYDWPPPWDGLAPAPYEMTAAQEDLGHEITVFCGRWPRSGSLENPGEVNIKTFLREPIPGTLNLLISPALFLYYLFWRKRNPVDVIHSHGHFGIWIYWWRTFLKRRFPKAKELQTPLVVHFHNTVKGRAENLKEMRKSVNPVSKSLSWPLAEKSDRWAVESAEALIFVSEDTRKEAIKFYNADPEKCYLVESGVNTRLFSRVGQEEKNKTRGDLELVENDIVVLNHGAIVERKNIHLLVEAMKFLPIRYKLLLAGPPSDEDYEAKISEIINVNHLGDRIVRVGYTPYPQVPIAFQAADIFVLPSSWEGFPKVVVQSLACGVPVLASGFKASEDIKGLFYLENTESENIAREIERIISESPRVDTEFIREHYSWTVMARKVQAIYDKLVRSQ